MIGRHYRYPNSKKRFLLIEIDGYIYRFNGGHWCTDTVFKDMIDCKTKVQNCDNNQLNLFYETTHTNTTNQDPQTGI